MVSLGSIKYHKGIRIEVIIQRSWRKYMSSVGLGGTWGDQGRVQAERDRT